MSKKEYVNCDDCGTGLVMAERIVGSVLIYHCEQCYQQLKAENKRLKEKAKEDFEISKEIRRGIIASFKLLTEVRDKENKWLKDGIELALDYLPECPNKAESFLKGALKGEVNEKENKPHDLSKNSMLVL